MIIPGDIFVDGSDRELIPYKGWFKILKDGTKVPTDFMDDNKGPFTMICNENVPPTYHRTYNLLNNEGNKILPFFVREIKYFEPGYYIVRDDNEDELINRGDVKGGFRTSDYISRVNVVTYKGKLISQTWFKDVVPRIDHILVTNDGIRWSKLNFCGGIYVSDTYKLGFGCVVKPKGDFYMIYDSEYNLLADNLFTSVMWADSSFWRVNLLYNKSEKTFFHGQGGDIIELAHSILTHNSIIALLERDGIWYSLNTRKVFTTCFRWNPQPGQQILE